MIRGPSIRNGVRGGGKQIGEEGGAGRMLAGSQIQLQRKKRLSPGKASPPHLFLQGKEKDDDRLKQKEGRKNNRKGSRRKKFLNLKGR